MKGSMGAKGMKLRKVLLFSSVVLIYSWIWLRILPSELFNKEFIVSLIRNLAFVCFSAYLVALISRFKSGKFIIPLLITAALIVAFDTVFLLMHFRQEWLPESSAVSDIPPPEQAKPEPSMSFHAEEFPHSILTKDSLLGFALNHNDTVRVEINMNGERLPDVLYITDSFGRRVNTGKDTIPDRKYAIFLGCSVTFGLNVNDSSTLPSLFEQQHPEYKAYNYGIPGSGPNQYLALLQDRNLAREIPQEDGIAIYPFFEHHVNRAISDYYCYEWNYATPYFHLHNGELLRDGDFKNGRWLMSRFFDLLSYSYFIKYMHFNFPGKLQPVHYKTTAAIVAGIRDEYEKQFGNDRFFVFMFPGFESGIIPYFEEKGLKVINCIQCVPDFWKEGEFIFPIDRHPTPDCYRMTADSLSLKIKPFLP